MSGYTFRPIDVWPGQLTAYRKPSPFEASWDSTSRLLHREVAALQDRREPTGVIIQLAVPEGAIRQDGQLVQGRKPPEHPGVIISFDSPSGPMRFACDHFEKPYYRATLDGWQVNARAIALGMEALRKVRRYGLGTGSEQYVGFTAIGQARPMGAAVEHEFTYAEALAFIAEAADCGSGYVRDVLHESADMGRWRRVYADAARRCHPDSGGSEELFKKLQAAVKVLKPPQ